MVIMKFSSGNFTQKGNRNLPSTISDFAYNVLCDVSINTFIDFISSLIRNLILKPE